MKLEKDFKLSSDFCQTVILPSSTVTKNLSGVSVALKRLVARRFIASRDRLVAAPR